MKNVGRYPDRDTSLAHLRLANDRLAEVSMTNEQIQQILDSRVSNYVTPTQVDQQAATRLSKSALSSDVANYIASSDIGRAGGYVSLSNGRIPTAQLNLDSYLHHLESTDPYRIINTMTTATAYSTTLTRAGSFTVSDPGYNWWPFFIGTFEVQITSGTPPAVITIMDSRNRVVAGGISSRRSGYSRVNVRPKNVPTAYIGNWTFTFYLSFFTGTGQVRHTSWEDSLAIRQVPWNGY